MKTKTYLITNQGICSTKKLAGLPFNAQPAFKSLFLILKLLFLSVLSEEGVKDYVPNRVGKCLFFIHESEAVVMPGGLKIWLNFGHWAVDRLILLLFISLCMKGV